MTITLMGSASHMVLIPGSMCGHLLLVQDLFIYTQQNKLVTLTVMHVILVAVSQGL